MTEPFVSGLVGWLIQEAGRASVRRFSDRVSRALEHVIRDAVRRAATWVCADDGQCQRTVALLLERRAVDLPMVDGTPMAHLDLAAREWVASIEHPVGEDGRLSVIGDHPLVDALRNEILEGIRDEATRGEGVLHPLWADYVATSNQQELLAAIAGVRGSGQERGQQNWRWCHKCQGLFFAGNPGSKCPAGGGHENVGSGDYSLLFT